MSELPEPIQFCLRTTKRVSSPKAGPLSPTETIILRAYTFDMEVQNGDLSQFFYNTDASPEIAEETARARGEIGASESAAILRQAASVVCRPEYKSYVGTWGGYLSKVDPEQRLRAFESELGRIEDNVDGLLEKFILDHRHELESRKI
jgi:hypothetical protein